MANMMGPIPSGGRGGATAGAVKPISGAGLQKPPKQGKVKGISTPFSNRIMSGGKR